MTVADYVLAPLHHAFENGYAPLTVSEARAVIAEVERLREDNHELRLMVEEAARAENANAEDAKKERAAAVAFVRGAKLDELADAIERGEHRREEAVCAHGNTECQRCGVGPGCGEHRREEGA